MKDLSGPVAGVVSRSKSLVRGLFLQLLHAILQNPDSIRLSVEDCEDTLEGTAQDGGQPKSPAPASSVCDKTPDRGAHDGANQTGELHHTNGTAPLLLREHVRNDRGVQSPRRRGHPDQGAECEEHGEAGAGGASHGEENKEDGRGVVNGQAAVGLGARREQEGTEDLPKFPDRDEENLVGVVVRVEVVQDDGSGGGAHDDCQVTFRSRPYRLKE